MIWPEQAKLLAYLGNAVVMAAALAAAIWMVERWFAAASSGGRAVLCTAALLAAGLVPAIALWTPTALPAVTMLVDAKAVAAAATVPGTRFSWVAVLVGLAGMAALIRAVWLVRGLLGLRALRQRSAATADPAIRHSPHVATPVTFGFLQPVILVPEAQWGQMPAAVREAVLAHEQAHIVRRDFLWNLGVEVATLTLWWHPAVIWLKRRLTLARECSCDELAAARVADYAERLLEAATQLAPGRPPAYALGVLDGDSLSNLNSLEARMLNLTRNSFPRPAARRALMAASVVLLSVTALTVTLFPVAAASADRKTYSMKDEGVKAPKLTHKVEPTYSEQARDAKIEGTVKLHLVVNEEGVAEDIYVVEGLEESLDQHAIEAIGQWRFVPGTKDGQPVAVEATVEVNFRLL
ncbi:MAG: M56 family metallopeptidase [Acidobacteria bacterium]|nr:M56 family metallopeptidase [Acidobacteriota bacterium]